MIYFLFVYTGSSELTGGYNHYRLMSNFKIRGGVQISTHKFGYWCVWEDGWLGGGEGSDI